MIKVFTEKVSPDLQYRVPSSDVLGVFPHDLREEAGVVSSAGLVGWLGLAVG